jgi:hypothetical protein
MAICKTCKQEMATAEGCTLTQLVFIPYVANKRGKTLLDKSSSVPYERVPFGAEQENPSCRAPECPDCNVKPGKYHHPNCDWESCPRCQRQLISCSCSEQGLFV